jgi:HAD superfamily hydrolase (TIGR01484 family)
MKTKILLCSDLDRTILPNGEQPESPVVRALLARFIEQSGATLVYVSGRSKPLMLQAIDDFELPVPAFAIGDVGTTLYEIERGRWTRSEAWESEIGADWSGRTVSDLARSLDGIEGLTAQEAEKQGRYKLSFYASPEANRNDLLRCVAARLEARGVRASLIWSVDEGRRIGLLDVLPERATKLHAVRFLSERLGFADGRTLFAGDSGNDLPALTSELKSVLVANAIEEVRGEAVRESRRAGTSDSLYLAGGEFLGLNGNYAAGVLEGVAHFFPEARETLARLIREAD